MGSLLTLDLSHTGIKSLPSSLSCLLNLRTLLVEHCHLDCISPIQKLERLEILSFCASSVLRYTKDIENWSSLKLLDLSDRDWREGFPTKLIASAFNLEELYMYDLLDGEPLTHIASLTRLKVLILDCMKCDRILSRDIPNWENLTRFKLRFFSTHEPASLDISSTVYDVFFPTLWNWPHTQRVIALELPSKLVVANWVKVLVARTEVLSLLNCEGVNSVMELDEMGLNHLKVLHLHGRSTMKSVISTVPGWTPKFGLSSLEELQVIFMHNLESICIGILPDGFFCQLKTLQIINCKRMTCLIIQSEDQSSASEISNCPPFPSFPNLTSLMIRDCLLLQCVFPLTVARGLLQLTNLEVHSCLSMKMIFSNDSGAEKDKLILPSLRILSIFGLYNMSTLSLPGLVIHCPRLENLSVEACDNLKSLPFGLENVPKLQKLEADLDWFIELEWRDQGSKTHLREVLHHN